MRHIISVLVENEAGALSRLVGLFSQRGYNIETLNVAPTEDPTFSRLSLTSYGADHKIEEITFTEDPVSVSGKLKAEQMDADELLYQQMWKDYFKTMAIKQRINLKLQRQHMPVRYWKYLTEMQ